MSLEFYPPVVVELEEVKSKEIGADAGLDDDCNEIEDACQGKGADMPRVIKVIGSQTPETRTQLAMRYKEMFNKELKDTMKGECGKGDFGTVMQFLAVSPIEADCMMINSGDPVVIPFVLSGRTNKEMAMLKKKYFDVYGKDMGQFVIGKLAGDLEKLMVLLMQGMEEAFDPAIHTAEKVEQDTEELYNKGEATKGSDIDSILKILALSPPQHMTKISTCYVGKYGCSIQRSMEKILKKDIAYAINILIGQKTDPMNCTSWLINESFKSGMLSSLKDLQLSAALVRFQPFMKQVDAEYTKSHKVGIKERVEGDAKKHFQEILVTIINTGKKM